MQVNYWDDGDGFHVAGNSLPAESDVPEPVTETPEVAAARLRHEAVHAQALQASILASLAAEETDQTRVEGAAPGDLGDLPPVYDEDGTELRRYPAPQHASLYDPSHVHDADRDAVIISNPDLEPDSFNDIQLFRGRARGYHPRAQARAQGRARRQQPDDDQVRRPGRKGTRTLCESQPATTAHVSLPQYAQQARADGFYYSFHYPAPVLVGAREAQPAFSVSQRAASFGAIPVAAVHDAQVSPAQEGARAAAMQYARRPVYTEPRP